MNYSIVLPLKSEAKSLVFGVLSSGTGKTWADDLRLLVDGKPIWDAPAVEKPKTSLDVDHEFDGGSGLTLSSLTKTQIDNLARSARSGGFSNTTMQRSHPDSIIGISISFVCCLK